MRINYSVNLAFRLGTLRFRQIGWIPPTADLSSLDLGRSVNFDRAVLSFFAIRQFKKRGYPPGQPQLEKYVKAT